MDKVISEIIKLHKLVLSSSREIVALKIFFFQLPAIQNFTGDRMNLVTPPNSNGWTIPLKVPKCEIFHRSDFDDFYTITSLCEGDFGVKIKKLETYLGVHLGVQSSLRVCSVYF